MGRPSRERIFAQFDQALQDLRESGGLPTPDEARGIWDDIWHREAHHSTAIEGNTLVLREVRELLEHGRAVGAKPLAEYLEVVGYGQAAEWVYRQAHPESEPEAPEIVTITEVRRIHTLAMTPVWDVSPHPDAGPQEGPGSFRQHDIHAFPGGMKPPSWVQIEAEIAAWVSDTNSDLAPTVSGSPSDSIALMLLARIHTRFEQIHSFIDGNGRTGRLVLNLILVRLGWPPAVILQRERERYLRALARCDSGDPGPLAELIARSMMANLEQFLLPNIAGPARFIPLGALVDEKMSLPALQQAASRGRLEAHLGPDGKWRSSRRSVSEYKASRYQRS